MANLEDATFPAMQERGEATALPLKPRATDYKVDESFQQSFNFLSVRSTPKAGSENNVLYKITRQDFAGTTLKGHQALGLDQSPWFHVDEVLLPSGARMQSGWVARESEYHKIPTLVPKPHYFFEIFS